jgi:molybdopterin biosynthesis enzyme
LTGLPPLRQEQAMIPQGERAQRIMRLKPLAEVFREIDALAKPVAPREMGSSAAAGRVLAADVAASSSLPRKAIALRDGWAVRAELVADAGPSAPMPLSPAPPWVEVGEPLPEGADAVLPPDAVNVVGDKMEAIAAVSPGEGVLAVGADAEQGRVLRCAGERLRASDIAILRAAGITRVKIREPKVRVALSREVKESDDTVSALASALIEAEGGKAAFDRTIPLDRALADESAALVIGIGGTGMGRRDAGVQTLARIGRVALHGMGISPGETAALGAVGDKPVLLIPGRLDAALAILLIVSRRLMTRLSGALENETKTPVKLVRKIASQVGLAEVVPVRRAGEGIEPLGSGSIPSSALARADGWVLVPPESEGFAAGSTVEMRLFP